VFTSGVGEIQRESHWRGTAVAEWRGRRHSAWLAPAPGIRRVIPAGGIRPAAPLSRIAEDAGALRGARPGGARRTRPRVNLKIIRCVR